MRKKLNEKHKHDKQFKNKNYKRKQNQITNVCSIIRTRINRYKLTKVVEKLKKVEIKIIIVNGFVLFLLNP